MRAGEESPSDGWTLVEVLVSIVILSGVMLAIVGGLDTVVRSSVVNREVADTEAVARSYAEWVKDRPYVPCTADYPGWTPPPGFVARVWLVRHYSGAGSLDPVSWSTTCSSDGGLQMVVLRVRATSRDQTVRMLRVVKRDEES